MTSDYAAKAPNGARAKAMYAGFPGMEATVAAAAAYMLRHDLTPAEVLAGHDEWIADRMREMVPAGGRGGSRPIPKRPKKRSRAGDFAVLSHACPRCGGDVELYQMCPVESPRWRAQLACMADDCSWHGKSGLPIDALLAAGAAQIKHNVTEG